MNNEASPIRLCASKDQAPPVYTYAAEGQQEIQMSSTVESAPVKRSNGPGHIQIKSSNPMMQDLNQLIQWRADGILTESEFQIAKQKLMGNAPTSSASNQKPKDIALRVKSDDHQPAVPDNSKMLGINPNQRERVIIQMSSTFTVDATIPPQLRDRGLTANEWNEMIGELNALGSKACHYPCHCIYVFMHILCFVVLFLSFVWLLYTLCPYGWCFDYHQKFLKQWVKKWNEKWYHKGFYIKMQNIKRDFHEMKYLCIAFTDEEIQKLQSEPAFQRGQDIWHQEHGEARGCPIDAHRII